MSIQRIKNTIVTHGDNIAIFVVGDNIETAVTHCIHYLLTYHQRRYSVGYIWRRLLMINTGIKFGGAHGKGLGNLVSID